MKNDTYIIPGIKELVFGVNNYDKDTNKITESIDTYFDFNSVQHLTIECLFKDVNYIGINLFTKIPSLIIRYGVSEEASARVEHGNMLFPLKKDDLDKAFDVYLAENICKKLNDASEDELLIYTHLLEKYVCSHEEVSELLLLVDKDIIVRHDINKLKKYTRRGC